MDDETGLRRVPPFLNPTKLLTTWAWGMAAAAFMLCVCVCVCVDRHGRRDWARRRASLLGAPAPKMPRMLLTWVVPLVRLQEGRLIETVGLDAAMLLRFIRFSECVCVCV